MTGSSCSCVHCGELPAHEFVSAEVIGSRIGGLVAKWTRGPGPNVLLTGPEPFAHPELPLIVSACPPRSRHWPAAGAVTVTIAPTPSARQARGFADWIGAAVDTGMVNDVWVTVADLEASHVHTLAGLHAVSPFSLAGGVS